MSAVQEVVAECGLHPNSSSGICDCVCVSVSVRALKGKRLELSIPNLVHIYSMAVAWRTLNQRSKGQTSRSPVYENHHGLMAAISYCHWHGLHII